MELQLIKTEEQYKKTIDFIDKNFEKSSADEGFSKLELAVHLVSVYEEERHSLEEKSNLVSIEVNEKVAKEIQYLTLKDDPFIPEELGFKESIQEGQSGTVAARIYSKDGFNIARPVEIDVRHWVVLDPNGNTNKVLLPNIYNAIFTLQACGMEISHEMYFEGDVDAMRVEGEKKAMKEFNEKVKENIIQKEEK